MDALSTRNLTKHFDGVRAVADVSVSFTKGQVTGLIGPNGSGKTTLINLLSGLLPADQGAIYVRGVKLEAVRPHHMSAYGITRTFQFVRLFEQMTVLDNLLVVLTERAIQRALFEKHQAYHERQARELLALIGLDDKRHELAAHLSYGQRKLLEMARALAMDADIYLFDEPFAGLFPEMVKAVIALIKSLKEQKKSIVLIEHDMNLIRELSDTLVVLREGRLLAEGTPADVLRRADVIEAYLGK